MIDTDEEYEKLKSYSPRQRNVLRKFGTFEDAKQSIEDTYERLKYTLSGQPRDFHARPPHYQTHHHYMPPASYPQQYQQYHPPPYKAVYEVTKFDNLMYFLPRCC